MAALLNKVQSIGVQIITNTTLEEFTETSNCVTLRTKELEFKTKNLLLATNGFASQLGIKEVKPARAQVLLTKPIPDLKIKGTFHLDQGFYYFRNIDNRILLGGGRNLNFKAEEITEMGETKLIQGKLREMLRKTVLPNTFFEIDQRWSGIMGVGDQKNPEVNRLSENVSCAVRLSGVGVAIGSLIGKELAELTN